MARANVTQKDGWLLIWTQTGQPSFAIPFIVFRLHGYGVYCVFRGVGVEKIRVT